MLKKSILSLINSFVVIYIVVFCAFALSLTAAGTTISLTDSTIARVLESSEHVKIIRHEQSIVLKNVVTFGSAIKTSDTIVLAEGEFITLMLNDGTIEKFVGPLKISAFTIGNIQSKSELARLSTSLMEFLFNLEKYRQDDSMGLRSPTDSQDKPLSIPRLISPPSGCVFLALPRQLKWQPLDGAIAYSVTLYDAVKVMWKYDTENTVVSIFHLDSLLQSGNPYFWIVEAHIGDVSLRSDQAEFSVLDSAAKGDLDLHLNEIERSVADSHLRHLLRARVYHYFDLKLECLAVIDEILTVSPRNYTASVIRAQLLEEMGLLEAAIEAYKSVILR